MNKFQNFFKEYKNEMIAFCIFLVGFFDFSISYAFAAVEPVRSIVIESKDTNFASGEEGSWQVTKSGYWTGYGEAEVTLDVDTSLMTNYQYTDVIFVLDISGSMLGKKLDRVKNDSKELISSLLSNKNNRVALISFDTESSIVSELTNDEELLTNEIDSLSVTGGTNYYQALVNVDSILQNYKKESGREMVVLFLTDGYPNVDTPNQIGEYQYLKSTYPYITINGIQYEMGNTILSPIKEISDNQFIADMDTLNNVLFDASVSPIEYDNYQIIDYIDNENFTLENKDDIKVSQGSVELTEENGKQKITWNIDNLSSGRDANLTMKLKLKEELIGQGGVYPTNESTEVVSKIENQEEDVSTTNTPILVDDYKVIYDGNAPEGCSVSNIPSSKQYSVYSTVELSNQILTCSGYEFKGWTITTDGVTRVSEDYFIMPGEDVVIKAEWSKIGITKSMDGTIYEQPESIMVDTEEEDWFNYSFINKDEVTSIVTKDNIDIPLTAIKSWDVSQEKNGSVVAYYEDDGSGQGTYKITIGGYGKIIATSGWYLFYGFHNMESIDLTYLDTSRVTNMGAIFAGCTSLVNLNLDNFDTSNVTNMGNMFDSCYSLKSLDLSEFDTSKATIMEQMFLMCEELVELNVSSFDTGQVTNMNSMFDSCYRLTSLDLSSFNTSQVSYMDDIFYECKSVVEIKFGAGWTNDKITDMSRMFSGLDCLTNVIFNGFKTSNVTNMRLMFDSCYSLTSLDLSSFDTSQVTDMSQMFLECTSLTNLDLSSFDTSNVTDISNIFGICTNLTNLNMSNAVFNATSYSAMFSSVPNGIAIIVKDTTAKTWMEARLSDEGITGTVTIAGA